MSTVEEIKRTIGQLSAPEQDRLIEWLYLQKARPVDHVMTRAVGETLLNEWGSTHDEHAYRDL